MTNSFQLPSFDRMKSIDLNTFTPFQLQASMELNNSLHEHPLVSTFFDTDDIRDEFISVYSNYMAYKTIVKRAVGNGDSIEEIRFCIPANNILAVLMEINCIYFMRYSRSINTFVALSTVFVERNIRETGIMTEMWREIDMGAFESSGDAHDGICLCTVIDQQVVFGASRESDRLFEEYRQDIINEHFRTNKQHNVIVDSTEIEINETNKDDLDECKICYGAESSYVCKDCKFPLCKNCLKHILKSTGECACCRKKDGFAVCVLKRKETEHELIDDLNFERPEEQSTPKGKQFALNEINQEIDYEINGPKDGDNYDIELQESLNRDEDDDDDDEDRYRDYRDDYEEDEDPLRNNQTLLSVNEATHRLRSIRPHRFGISAFMNRHPNPDGLDASTRIRRGRRRHRNDDGQ